MRSDYRSALDEDAAFNFPCWEYRSAYPSEPLIDWKDRWQRAGGPPCINSRFYAPKTHPVWKNLGDRHLFPDALGNPFPPYVNGSGFSLFEVQREECVALGLIDANDGVGAHNAQLLTDMFGDPSKATPAAIRAKRKDLEEALEMLRENGSRSTKQQQ
jgi:hypothetical protein